MTAQHALPDHAESSPRRARLRLTSGAPIRTRAHRTFAEDLKIRSSGPVWHRRERLAPAGFVHAAEAAGEWSLCGILLDSLHEFDRPFERYDASGRCPVCHAASAPARP